MLTNRTSRVLRIAEVEVRLEVDRRRQRLGDQHARRTDGLQQIGGEEARGSGVEHFEQIGVRPTDDVPVVTVESSEATADPTSGRDRHGGEQPPVTSVGQAEQVGRDLRRPVADQDAQGDVLVNDPHVLVDLSAGQVWVVLALGRELLGEVGAAGDLPDELPGGITQTRVTRPAKVLDLGLG